MTKEILTLSDLKVRNLDDFSPKYFKLNVKIWLLIFSLLFIWTFIYNLSHLSWLLIWVFLPLLSSFYVFSGKEALLQDNMIELFSEATYFLIWIKSCLLWIKRTDCIFRLKTIISLPFGQTGISNLRVKLTFPFVLVKNENLLMQTQAILSMYAG